MKWAFGIDIPHTLEDVCNAKRLARSRSRPSLKRGLAADGTSWRKMVRKRISERSSRGSRQRVLW